MSKQLTIGRAGRIPAEKGAGPTIAAPDRLRSAVRAAGTTGQAEAGDKAMSPVPPAATAGQAEAAVDELVLGDLLVEDVSIDGMCGVY